MAKLGNIWEERVINNKTREVSKGKILIGLPYNAMKCASYSGRLGNRKTSWKAQMLGIQQPNCPSFT